MRPGKQIPADNITALYYIFGNLDAETDVVVQSCLCSQALLNENTGVYGCRFMDCVCPYESPNPKRCLADQKKPGKCNKQIYVPKVPKTHKRSTGRKAIKDNKSINKYLKKRKDYYFASE